MLCHSVQFSTGCFSCFEATSSDPLRYVPHLLERCCAQRYRSTGCFSCFEATSSDPLRYVPHLLEHCCAHRPTGCFSCFQQLPLLEHPGNAGESTDLYSYDATFCTLSSGCKKALPQCLAKVSALVKDGAYVVKFCCLSGQCCHRCSVLSTNLSCWGLKLPRGSVQQCS